MALSKTAAQMVADARARIEEIETADAIAMVNDPAVQIVDLRDPRERKRTGVIPGAFHCPRGMLEFWVDPKSPYHKKIFAEDKKFLFHCASGWRSALSVAALKDMGFDAAHLKDGFSGWQKAGGPVEEVAPAPAKAASPRKPDAPSGPSDLDLPHGARIEKWGHRRYVGGGDSEAWYGIGRRQYHFLVAQGLRPDHVFLDVACGALRLGQYLIPALNAGHYYGIEGEEALVQAGLAEEMLFDVTALKKPSFAFNYDFDVSFCPGYDFAIAQSLFTHLTLEDISACFTALRGIARPDSRFYFTFFEGDEALNRSTVSHANKRWNYRFETLQKAAQAAGFDCRYIGDWGHARDQMMALATPA